MPATVKALSLVDAGACRVPLVTTTSPPISTLVELLLALSSPPDMRRSSLTARLKVEVLSVPAVIVRSFAVKELVDSVQLSDELLKRTA